MKKRDIILNVLPFVIWISLFILELFDFREWKFMFFSQIVLILGLPIILSVYNTVSSNDFGDVFIKNIFMAVSNVLGILFSSALSDSFVQPDPEASPVIALFIIITLIHVGVLSLICCGIKDILKKNDFTRIKFIKFKWKERWIITYMIQLKK